MLLLDTGLNRGRIVTSFTLDAIFVRFLLIQVLMDYIFLALTGAASSKNISGAEEKYLFLLGIHQFHLFLGITK
jgi:hypothetical protein